ncbi:GDSL esterase/lipase 6 [Tanacetum coccineum]
MMIKRTPQFLFFSSLLLMVFASVDAQIKSIIIFGDSQLDSGNNRFIKNCILQANFTPYGSSYFHHPTGRFTNGRTLADFICKEEWSLVHQGEVVKFLASLKAGQISTNLEVTPIQEQLQQFQGLIDQKHLRKNQIMKSLIFMASGSNDVFSYFLLPGASKLTPQQYVVTMLKELSLFVDKTYKVGARKFVFFTIGPVGCIPGRIIIQGAPTDRCMGRMNLMAKQYNEGLELFIKSIPTKYPGAIGVNAVVYNSVQKFRANPKRYSRQRLNHRHLFCFVLF